MFMLNKISESESEFIAYNNIQLMFMFCVRYIGHTVYIY